MMMIIGIEMGRYSKSLNISTKTSITLKCPDFDTRPRMFYTYLEEDSTGPEGKCCAPIDVEKRVDMNIRQMEDEKRAERKYCIEKNS